MAETEGDNGKATVDLVWAKRPTRATWQRQGRGPKVKVISSLIPTILRDIGPDHTIDFGPVERQLEKAAKRDVAEIGGGMSSAPTSKKEIEALKKKAEALKKKPEAMIIAANSIRMEEDGYSKDSQRIQNKSQEGISGLIAVRKSINTSRGALRLLLEILKLAIEQNDRASAYDLLWAIEAADALKAYEADLAEVVVVAVTEGGGGTEERYKALMKEAKGMKQAQLAKECEKRGMEKGGSKDDLLARLREAYKKESLVEPAVEAAPGPSKKDSKVKKGGKDKETEKPEKTPSATGGSAPKPALSAEATIVAEFYDKIQLVRSWRTAEPDMIEKQLTEMSHLLPPLSPFASSFKFDDWQIRVVDLIMNEKSALICAPTSSGKTVISSYVAARGRMARAVREKVKRPAAVEEEDDGGSDDDEPAGYAGNNVLFIVPSDPLVWQVGAHFAKWQGLDRSVALITDRLSYAPQPEQGRPATVVVGTPLAVEKALMKMRGKHGSFLESQGKPDYSSLVGGFDHYKWVVYDEVHSIGADTPDGLALQRLIKSLKCNFLALSATVGNAEELRTWMERVRGEQVNAETVNANTEVNMEVHEGRFINLQRHIWTSPTSSRKTDGSIAAPGDLDLVPLHPLSAVSHKFLEDGGFGKSALPMTPQDSFTLWTNMKKYYDIDVISYLDPHAFFAGSDRITLLKTKDYEMVLKRGLEDLSRSHPEQTQQLLASFAVSDLPAEFNIYDLVQRLRVKDSAGNDKLPCIVFHLDMVHLIGRFKELLYGLESKQREAHPAYYEVLEGRRRMAGAEKETALKSCSTEEEKEQLMNESEALGTVDTEQPHPDYVLNVRSPISRQEYEEILNDVKYFDFRQEPEKAKLHPLMRALRRGIGLYIDEVSFQGYKRAVMRLATKGKLAVVFSDDSLAFGVNMPFRTCVFCGDMGGRLNTLLMQQMSGRAGRRGLDTQGHLVYAGATAAFVRNMVISVIPAIKGSDPRYLTLFLSTVCSEHCNPRSYPHQTDVIGRTPLCDFVEPKHAFNMNEVSRRLMLELKLIEECSTLSSHGDAIDMFDYSVAAFERSATPSGYRPRAPYNAACLWMVWDMCDHLAESVAVVKFLPLLLRDFAGPSRVANYGESEDVQFEFIASILHIIDRRPAKPDGMVLGENAYITNTSVVKRQELRTRISFIQAEIVKHNAEIMALSASGDFPHVEKLLLPVPDKDTPLDGTLLHCFITGTTDGVPFSQKHEIKQRLWDLGCFLRSMHNSLWPDKGKYGKLALVTRKCFMRTQYTTSDHIKDAIDFINVAAYELEGENVDQITAGIDASIWNSLHA